MTNPVLTKKLNKAGREERIEWVKVRHEGDHIRATSGRGWHTIKQLKMGVCGCSCKDFEFQHGPIEERCCKHMWALFKLGVIGLTQSQIAAWTAREYREERLAREKAEKLLRERTVRDFPQVHIADNSVLKGTA